MGSYKISFKPSVAKDFKELPGSIISRLMKRIEDLRFDPLPRQATKLSKAERLYRLRVGDYRIIYEVDMENEQLIIHYVRHRKRVYRDL
jgi:mRNA interferase RelE/StbE